MRVTKNTLKEEIDYRISLLEDKMQESSQKPLDEDNLYWFYAQEHSFYTEVREMIDFFECKD